MPPLTTNAWLRFDAIRAGVHAAAPASVLEVGAGEGALGSWLAGRADYVGVERDDRSRAVAAERLAALGRGRIVGDLAEVGEQTFDLVCSFEVLEHIEDDAAALRAWHDHLVPDGHLLLSVPAHVDQYGAADRLVGHFRRYDRDALAALLFATGYRVLRISSYGAGFGHVLQRGRNLLANRSLDRAAAPERVEDRTASSGRWFQPGSAAAATALAAVAAPGRLLQAPFARTDVGTGYVVLARRQP
ncbi:MAG: class I SAM-dependent methyltransferase [Actinomycetota bacterium]